MVKQQSLYVLERFGKFNRVLNPGLNFMLPIVDTVPFRVSMKEQVVEIAE
jgi:regulator of protease activity HflC (stomatin/prohibitin superfamily)